MTQPDPYPSQSRLLGISGRTAEPVSAVPTYRGAKAVGALLLATAFIVTPSAIDAQQSSTKAAAAQPGDERPNPAGAPESQPNPVRPRFGAASGRARPPASAATPQEVNRGDEPPVSPPPRDLFPARFEATTYEVQLPEALVTGLDAQTLEAKADSAQSLAKALAELGKAKVLYTVDQTVNLFGEKIALSEAEPFVTGSRMSPSGQPIDATIYQSLGLNIHISAVTMPPELNRKGLIAQLDCNLSVLAPSEEEIAGSIKRKVIRKVEISHSETPKFGKPRVLLSVIGAGRNNAAMPPTAYVVRYVFAETNPQ